MPLPVHNRWLLGARPRTLPAALVPVAVGTAVASAGGHVIWWRAAAALVVSLALQVGVNYANDYSDGVRGTDAARVGPLRLVASGLASPPAVRAAALAAFAVAAVAGLALAVAVGPQLLAVGAAAIAAAWFYTGGPRPYGYAGMGELFVFVFFGLVATAGTAYVQLDRLTALSALAAVPVGLLAVALLVVNNLRDIDGDATAGKRTLAVRLGAPATRALYQGCLLASFALTVAVAAWRPWALLALVALPLAVPPARRVRHRESGRGLIEVLGATGRLQIAFGALLTVGIAL
ncbi:MAG TPA: 1,4-dihydroxy-2-naphthoate polyprenyltransferase [Acidimicrobiales bacterium]|nr:1,4-dihydroxy-2-naphthoate polyprenyltransferase [Acidimicrobiales bacterium]